MARRPRKWTIVMIGAVVALLTVVLSALEPIAPHLTDASLESITKLLTTDRTRLNLEQEEMSYQDTVRVQTMADLAQVYARENADKLQIAYVSFTPEAAKMPADDRGYGLHIVKRLDLPVGNGETKTIYVNEQWREDKTSKGIVFPDEIRIQTQVASGRRRVRGSDKLYVFDSIRIAWQAFNRDPLIARHTIYKRVNDKNEVRPSRSTVSAPFACATCHGPTNRFAEGFLAKSEDRNYEAIVQDKYFSLPVAEMRGYREYIAYLEQSRIDPSFIQKVKTRLADIRKASEVPALFAMLTGSSETEGIVWLPEDTPLEPGHIEIAKGRQGVYQDAAGRWRTDAIEDLIEGKYVWWEPEPVIP